MLMAVMIALAQSLMKHRGGWDAVKLKGKVLRFGVRLVFGGLRDPSQAI
jgi:hypothetical protein